MHNKTLVIIQSNYIPWKGYFDLINMADQFIVYDHVQYTRRDWRNRNKIKTPRGPRWLTIPVSVKGKYDQPINETTISDPNWAHDHWKTIRHNYAHAPHFKTYEDRFERLYADISSEYLSVINCHFIRAVCDILGITTPISFSEDFELIGNPSETLLNLCKQTGADHYLSGPSARNYLDETLFEREGIALSYMNYDGYPEYPQLYPPFEHKVSVIDLIFNTGPDAPRYVKSFQS
jgi:hypothetical protein